MITLKLLRKNGWEVNQDTDEHGQKSVGEYTCYHKETSIQVCRDKDNVFWTDYCGEIITLKSYNQILKIVELARELKGPPVP